MNETECNFYEPEEGRTPEPVMKAIAIDRETGKIIGGIGLDDRDFPRQQVVTGIQNIRLLTSNGTQKRPQK